MSLEHRYRRLLRAYPRSYQARRGEEMLGTLIESAAPGQTRPTRREVADLLAGAMRERLGLHALPRFEAGLRIAGPIGLVVATGAAVDAWAPDGPVGSAVVAAAWLLAAVLRSLVPRLSALPILAWLITVGVGVGQLAGVVPGSLRLLTLPVAFGLIAALGATVTRPEPSTVERLAVPAAVAAVVADSLFSGPSFVPPIWSGLVWLAPVIGLAVGALRTAEYRPIAATRTADATGADPTDPIEVTAAEPEVTATHGTGAAVTGATMTGVDVSGGTAARPVVTAGGRAGSAGWSGASQTAVAWSRDAWETGDWATGFWAAAVLLVAVPTSRGYIPFVGGFGWEGGLLVTAFLAVLCGLCVALAAAQRTQRPPADANVALTAIGSYGLGAAAGIGAAAAAIGVGGLFAGRYLGGVARGDLVVLALPIVAAAFGLLARLRLPGIRPLVRAGVGLTLIGLVTVMAAGYTTTVQPPLLAILAVLLVVALAGSPAPTPGRILVGAVVAYGLTILAGAAVQPALIGRAPSTAVTDYWPRYAIEVQETAVPLLAGIILLPALGWAVQAVLRGRRPGPGLVIVAAIALVWLVQLTRPWALLDVKLMAGIVIGALVALAVRRPVRPHRDPVAATLLRRAVTGPADDDAATVTQQP